MAENVESGGTISFRHEKNPSLNVEEKEEINKAYDKYYERKRIEKRNRTIIYIIIVIIILIALGFFLLR